MAKHRVNLLFKNFPEQFPYHLEREYPRILYQLMHLWSEARFDTYIKELLVSDRHDRSGFSPHLISELLFINTLHETCRAQNLKLPPIQDVWENLPPANRSPQSYFRALQRGDLTQMQLYLDAGIPIDYQFEDGGGTPLSIAAINNQTALAALLIQSGADVDAHDLGEYTPLHWAAFFGYIGVANLLLQSGANINARQNTKSTPLFLAVLRNHLGMAALLVRHGANLQLSSDDGTPLEVALEKGWTDMANLLRISMNT